MPKYVTSSLVSPIATHEDFCGVRPTISLVSVEQQDTGLRKFGEIPNSEAFLSGSMPFAGIVSTVSRVVEEHLESGWIAGDSVTLEDVLAADMWAREQVKVAMEQ
jgi:hypothetical protein